MHIPPASSTKPFPSQMALSTWKGSTRLWVKAFCQHEGKCGLDSWLFLHPSPWFLLSLGFFSILQCRQFTHCCRCLHIIDSDKDHETTHPPKPSVQMTPLRERTVTPRSIVRAHSSISSKDIIPSRSQVQSRRVTWALWFDNPCLSLGAHFHVQQPCDCTSCVFPTICLCDFT